MLHGYSMVTTPGSILFNLSYPLKHHPTQKETQRDLKRSCGNLLQQVRSFLPSRARLAGGDPLIALDQRPWLRHFFPGSSWKSWEVTEITGSCLRMGEWGVSFYHPMVSKISCPPWTSCNCLGSTSNLWAHWWAMMENAVTSLQLYNICMRNTMQCNLM